MIFTSIANITNIQSKPPNKNRCLTNRCWIIDVEKPVLKIRCCSTCSRKGVKSIVIYDRTTLTIVLQEINVVKHSYLAVLLEYSWLRSYCYHSGRRLFLDALIAFQRSRVSLTCACRIDHQMLTLSKLIALWQQSAMNPFCISAAAFCF